MTPAPTAMPDPVSPQPVPSITIAAQLRAHLRAALGPRYAGMPLNVAGGPNDSPRVFVRWTDGPSCVAMDALVTAFKRLHGDRTAIPIALCMTEFRQRGIVVHLRGGQLVTVLLYRSYSFAFLRRCDASVTVGPRSPAEDSVSGDEAAQRATTYAIQTDGPDVPAVVVTARRRPTDARRRRAEGPLGSPGGEASLAAELRANGVEE